MSTGVMTPRLSRAAPALRLLSILLAAAVTTFAGFEAVRQPSLYRPVAAILIGGLLICVAIRWPRAAVVATFGFLVVMALIRRLLIGPAGWSSYDPLLLVAPIVGMVLVQRNFAGRRRPLAPDLLSKLIVWLVVLMAIEAFNPLSGGPLAGLAGLLFICAPLIWFFVGRDVIDRRTLLTLFGWVVVWGTIVALYGLEQTFGGLPSWDRAWVDLGGYTALLVLGSIRAFGTLSSSAEYAAYLAIAALLAFAFLLHRRLLALVAIPILAWALFYESSRGVVVLALVAGLSVVVLRLRKPAIAAVVMLAGLAIGVATLQLAGAAPQASAEAANPLVAHQLDGLLHPFDPQQSTLVGHWNWAVSGVVIGLHSPLGLGTAATNLAGDKLGALPIGTELDLSNAFVSLGLAGGLLYATVLVVTFRNVLSAHVATHDVATLAIVGVLAVTLGQWLNGGQYAVAPLVWLAAGWATRERTLRRQPLTEAERSR